MLKPSDKLVSELVHNIHAKIASGEYAAGTRLRQETLAREFEVSRTPIREALRQLEAKGVISQAHRRSAVVCAPSSRDVRETYQVRAELEGLAAQLAAEWITDEQIDRLRQIHERFVRAVKELSVSRSDRSRRTSKASKEWIETNRAFHSLIYEACNNQRLRRMIADLNLGYTRTIMLSSSLGMDTHRMRRTIAHHEAILRALEARDSVESRRVMTKHILESSDFVIAWFENQARAGED